MMAHPMIGMIKSLSSQVRWTLNFMTVSCIFQKFAPRLPKNILPDKPLIKRRRTNFSHYWVSKESLSITQFQPKHHRNFTHDIVAQHVDGFG